ncbi:HNH endonuclease [Cryobacterium sp. GrIS_2_6]|uniref:HNH endonuclease n=1 Tax=Cryobacterium sp. GrIS_2_6 TaxID=3162785 RepID=UPI0034DD8B15
MICKRCSTELSGKQTSYCSLRCSKLHLKSLYRKRSSERLKLIRAADRSRTPGPRFASKKDRRELGLDPGECVRCRSTYDLQMAHFIPHWAKGSNRRDNIIVLCRSCHHEYDLLNMSFWALAA